MLTELCSVRDVNGVHKLVRVCCNVEKGIGIHLLGMADAQVKESLLRTATALQSNGYHLPGQKITIRIVPEGMPYEQEIQVTGSWLDLPIALSIIIASGQAKVDPKRAGMFIIAGELGLDGSIRPSYRLLGQRVYELMSSSLGISGCIVPFRTATEMCLNTPLAYTPRGLKDAVKILESEKGAGVEKMIAWQTSDWKTIVDALNTFSK